MGTNVSVYLSDEALAKLDAAVTKQAAEDQALGLSGRKVASRSSIIERLIRENLETQGALDRATITYFVIKLGEAYGAERISLFGSYARNEATETSDVDILIDRTGSKIKGMFDMGGLYCDLRDSIGKEIDLVTTQTLEQASTRQRTPLFVDNLYAERIQIYE